MGKRQDTFIDILKLTTETHDPKKIDRPTQQDVLNSKYKNDVQRVYRCLGGILDVFPVRVGNWDMNIDCIAVELDEELHFNRYRSITFESCLYTNLKTFPTTDYKKFCEIHESDCLKAGRYEGKWTNRSCEKQFGAASCYGDLSGDGAPRWKQRAFYDFIKDISPLIFGHSMARVSIWDELKVDGCLVKVSKILDKRMCSASAPLYELIQKRCLK